MSSPPVIYRVGNILNVVFPRPPLMLDGEVASTYVVNQTTNTKRLPAPLVILQPEQALPLMPAPAEER